MKNTLRSTVRSAAVALAGALLLGGGAHAAGHSGDASGCNANEARYDVNACRREAGAARVEARRGGLTSPSQEQLMQNASQRCKLLPPADRPDCMMRIRGTDTNTSGSVEGGGILQETVRPVPSR
ncbi:hypothetical protein [Xylophilus sp. ASV27]|uniref:hypothetical protein n=1 Tax=Xylophilus sp. ASV27 TaxID=2795129 RepID=UPI0018ED93EA|nr:hypothetical protein [Xylophilus sp. ASV27]